MIGAKINGMIVPIDRSPETGDIVEILTSSASKGPSRDWLTIVKTSEARTKIRSWFKKEKRADNIVAGKAMIEAEFRKFAKATTEPKRNEMVAAVGKRLGFMSADDLYNTLGYGGISMGKLSGKLRDEYERNLEALEAENAEPITVEQIKVVSNPKTVRAGGGIVVDGAHGCQVKFARCCNPLPGDEVVGFITKGFGISIHKTDCPNVKQGKENPDNADRWVEAHWEKGDASSEQSMYEAQITIYVRDRLGIVADISVALSEMRVFLLQINTTTGSTPEESIIHLKISCKNVEHYHSIVARLRAIGGVLDIVRGFS